MKHVSRCQRWTIAERNTIAQWQTREGAGRNDKDRWVTLDFKSCCCPSRVGRRWGRNEAEKKVFSYLNNSTAGKERNTKGMTALSLKDRTRIELGISRIGGRGQSRKGGLGSEERMRCLYSYCTSYCGTHWHLHGTPIHY